MPHDSLDACVQQVASQDATGGRLVVDALGAAEQRHAGERLRVHHAVLFQTWNETISRLSRS
jgi:hypothetical protein